MWSEFYNVLTTRSSELLNLIQQHIEISMLSLLIAIVIAVPTGILLTRTPKLAGPIIGVASIFQTIPSLALLVFMVPIMGTGKWPAIVALTIYGLLPILRNTYIGIENVNQSTIRAGVGMGMTNMQQLFIVEIPLATRVIMGGIRTATVLVVGVATVAGLIGAGGLGDFIFRGLSTNNTGLILAGAIPAAVIALLFDLLLKYVENYSAPGRKKGSIFSKVAFFSIIGVLLVIMSFGVVKTIFSSDDMVISGKADTEQEILVYAYKELIERNTDIKVRKESYITGTSNLVEGMNNGQYDMYVEYTGTALVDILKEDDFEYGTPEEVYEHVKQRYEEDMNSEWLDIIGFNNTYAVAMRKDDVEKNGIETLSDLRKVSRDLRFGGSAEFQERSDGFIGLQELYSLEFKQVETLDSGIVYESLRTNNIDVADVYATDARIEAFDLQIIEDNKNLFPPYYAAPVVNKELLKKHPELRDILNSFAGKIDDDRMRELNKRVDIDGKTEKEVAMELLREEGLID
ncbi:glycine betaine ABC transporter substrate-binding protein [Nosocomiicoccus sp. HMSC09A07]|uniref:glycine betaine ABC transporter substrate-binding protein n=1 Tax=Nosocomiicoccus sp. HMSC09A07 TaxID=1581145 RepID=UPI0008A1034D|nr:glycine betaine ABC transporter substrate-binding protein [Nosocomiicoccus sp. HMSC09A07]OFS61821.1 glycine/betaine ABC transporter [Nosocomiicoccus sp. HMSC09A07]